MPLKENITNSFAEITIIIIHSVFFIFFLFCYSDVDKS